MQSRRQDTTVTASRTSPSPPSPTTVTTVADSDSDDSEEDAMTTASTQQSAVTTTVPTSERSPVPPSTGIRNEYARPSNGHGHGHYQRGRPDGLDERSLFKGDHMRRKQAIVQKAERTKWIAKNRYRKLPIRPPKLRSTGGLNDTKSEFTKKKTLKVVGYGSEKKVMVADQPLRGRSADHGPLGTVSFGGAIEADHERNATDNSINVSFDRTFGHEMYYLFG